MVILWLVVVEIFHSMVFHCYVVCSMIATISESVVCVVQLCHVSVVLLVLLKAVPLSGGVWGGRTVIASTWALVSSFPCCWPQNHVSGHDC